MAWLAQYPDSSDFKRQAEKALSLQLGLASPFWLAFGAVASAGLTWWWMNRLTSATNLEACLAPRKLKAAEPPVVEAKVAVIAPIIETPVIEAEAVVVIDEAVVEAVVEAPGAPDDLTRLVGIGPKVAAALAERGVTRFAHLAAWTEADLAGFDADMKLLGRGARDAWIAQAKRLAAEG